MYKFLLTIFTVATLLISNVSAIRAQESVDASASIRHDVIDNGFDYRVLNLTNFLNRYDSPLTPYAAEFVFYADTYGIDYRMVPAITGVESTFGKHIPFKSFNAYGWANGEYRFSSWEDSIEHVSMTLRTKYIDKGAGTIAKIARRYAPPSSTWGGKVKFFVAKIDTLPLTFDI
jgi:hypothetical protein